ncbi:Neuronal pentraxin receptor [Tupaia chinensis]|uniref:Neuronal pentraxin receptor n=1 Tax=Tupaia chinensis TaxID=246437 RepID=L9K759_TUPCH|nr:Neuronal pentraxin receptor [Tupaia chinensis]
MGIDKRKGTANARMPEKSETPPPLLGPRRYSDWTRSHGHVPMVPCWMHTRGHQIRAQVLPPPSTLRKAGQFHDAKRRMLGAGDPHEEDKAPDLKKPTDWREDVRQIRARRDLVDSVTDNENDTIRELTGKLGRCESGLPRGLQDAGPRRDTMADGPYDSPALILELEDAARALRDRIDRLEQELPARVNFSAAPAPAPVVPTALHSKMDELEGQLLAKVLALEKERAALSHSSHQQQQEVEKELGALQGRVTELEHGPSAYSPPDAFKISIPIRNNYMYARVRKALPELYAFTACMWLRSRLNGPGQGTPFSYSVPGQANEIVLLEAGQDPMELLINDKVAQLPLSLKDKGWHHICIAWTTRDGLWSAYQDGELQGSGENLAAWHPIKPHGILILGQEQDTLGGRFDATQAFVGDIAQFNLWDHALTPTQVLGIANCTAPLLGNVVPWEDKLVEAFGGATKATFDVCKGRAKA